MKDKIKDLLFEISYLIPVFILHIMVGSKFAESDFEKVSLIFLMIPLSLCVGVSLVNVVRKIMDFKSYLQTRKIARVTGLDLCSKCKGEGWLDWIEQIKGKEVRSNNDQIFP
jgi:hypothetical protein